MLDITSPTATPVDQKEFCSTGSALAYRLRGAYPSARVRLALQLINGEMSLKHLTVKQACAITGANLRLVNQHRHQMAGQPLSEVRKERAIERLLDRVLKEGGIDKVFKHLDQLTQPAVTAE
jgi:hypothetical protein